MSSDNDDDCYDDDDDDDNDDADEDDADEDDDERSDLRKWANEARHHYKGYLPPSRHSRQSTGQYNVCHTKHCIVQWISYKKHWTVHFNAT